MLISCSLVFKTDELMLIGCSLVFKTDELMLIGCGLGPVPPPNIKFR